MKKIFFLMLILTSGFFFAGSPVANAACCSNTCSTVQSSCIPTNWFANIDCSEIESCAVKQATKNTATTSGAGCCTDNCSTVQSSCIPTNWFVGIDCSEVPKCAKLQAEAAAAASAGDTVFPNPLGSVTTVSALLSSILTNLMGIIAIISLIFIILGGLMYMLSAGNEAMVTRAKKTWTGAVIGLAIAMAAPTFLKTIQAILGGNSSTGASADSWVSNALTLRDIATNVANLLLSLVGIIAMISMIIGGLMYLSSAGDEKRIDTGKDIFKYSIIGLIVAFSALIVIRTVNALLTGGA